MKSSSLDRRSFLSLSTQAAALSLVPPGLWAAQSLPKEELTALTLHEAATRVRSRAVSPMELTQACLARIERYDAKVNAFIAVTRELALAQAREAEQEIVRGRWRGPLHGIPIALKDNIDTAGVRTTAGSDVFKGRIPATEGAAASGDGGVRRELDELGPGVVAGLRHCAPTDGEVVGLRYSTSRMLRKIGFRGRATRRSSDRNDENDRNDQK